MLLPRSSSRLRLLLTEVGRHGELGRVAEPVDLLAFQLAFSTQHLVPQHHTDGALHPRFDPS